MMSISYYEKTFYTSFRCYKPLAAYNGPLVKTTAEKNIVNRIT